MKTSFKKKIKISWNCFLNPIRIILCSTISRYLAASFHKQTESLKTMALRFFINLLVSIVT